MPTLTHTSVLKGPVVIERGSVKIWSQSAAKVVWTEETKDITSDSHGKIDTVVTSRRAEISLTPEMWTAGLIALAWPYAATLPGTSLCGSVDVPTTIHCLGEAKKYTFARTAVIKQPDLNFALGGPLIGEMTIGAVPATGEDLDDADSIVAIAADADSTDATYDPSKIIAGPYDFTWGGSTILSEAGFKLSFETSTQLETIEGLGAFDWTLKDVGVTGSGILAHLSLEELLTLHKAQGAGNGIGTRGSARGTNFVATATGLSATINLACLTSGAETRFGSAVRRPGTINFAAHRTITVGVLAPLWTLGTGA
jgi:hypothetical protein